ncbi:MAG: TAXI family TRAP transporter solute-binding subunit [Magnetococcales bacterium]|nr:TAXI family TRAP transporter solute-binding subunit [Magnetococcales bacterium]
MACIPTNGVKFMFFFFMIHALISSFPLPLHARPLLLLATDRTNPLQQVAGNALCRHTSQDEPLCRTVPTDGPVDGIQRLVEGTVQLALVSSPGAVQAWTGSPPFKTQNNHLRLIFRLYPEAVALVGSGMGTLKDIFEKRVNIGPAGSDLERLVMELMVSCNIWPSDLLATLREDPARMPEALREGRLDGYFLVAGHPAKMIRQTLKETSVQLAALNDPCIDLLVKKSPHLRKMAIDGGTYQGIDKDIPSFGFDTLLLTSDKVSTETIAEFAEFVFSNIDDFRKRHSAFLAIDRTSLRGRFIVPHHNGVKSLLGTHHD